MAMPKITFNERDLFFYGFMILLFLVTLILIIEMMEENTAEINLECAKLGLPNKCTEENKCERDCIMLGKEYYRYEDEGIIRSDNCWCKVGNHIEQVW